MQERFRRSIRSISALVFICLGSIGSSQLHNNNCPDLRLKLEDLAKADLDVREATGNNDHPKIAKWNRFSGVPDRSPYCASWIVHTYFEAGVTSIPKSAWSPSLFPKNNRTMWSWKLLPGKEIKKMDVLGIYYRSRKRIAHVGMYNYSFGDHIASYEANTSTAAVDGTEADRDARIGGGNTKKTRHKRVWYGSSTFITCDK